MKRTLKFHYAWVVFISLVLLKIGVGGVVYCIAGNFVTPVVEDLGYSVSQFTMVVSVEAFAMAVMYTTASRVLSQKKLGIVMGIGSMAQVVGVGLMGIYNSLFLFYFSGALIGIGVAFTGFVAVPMVVNMWFKKKAGMVLGIVIAAENIAMILYTLLTAELIERVGWRSTYIIIAIMAFVLSVPAVLLCLKSPAEVGCKPYGEDDLRGMQIQADSEWGLTRKQAVKSPLLYIAWGACMLYSIGCGVQQYIANFATMELGQSIAFGANAAMSMSIGCVFSSTILGYINDKFGVRMGLGYGAACIIIGYIFMVMSIQNPDLCIPGAFIVGLGGSMYTVQCPLIARMTLGGKDYASIWSLMMMGNSMIGAFTFSSIGLFYDKSGSYRGAFFMAIALYIAAFLIGSIAVSLGKKYQIKT